MEKIEELRKKMQKLLKKELLDETSDKFNRYYFRINPKKIKNVTGLLVNDLDGRLVALSANDDGVKGFDLVYHFDFSHQEKRLHVCIKARVARNTPVIDSITDIAWSANWAERELMDLMGITFKGHPDPRKLFLPYAWPSEEVG